MPQKTPATRPGTFSNPLRASSVAHLPQPRKASNHRSISSKIIATGSCGSTSMCRVVRPRPKRALWVMLLQRKIRRTGAIERWSAPARLDRAAQRGSPRPLCAANDLNALVRHATLIGTCFLPGERLLLKLLSPPPLHPFQDVLRQMFSIHDSILPGKPACFAGEQMRRGRGLIVLARSRLSSSRRETFCSPGHY
jgi:hypothetical protein